MLSEIRRYYYAGKVFRFFVHHPYIYQSVLRDVWQKKVLGSDHERPRNIILKLSARCNAFCEFCYAKNDTQSAQPEVTLEEWKEVIDQAKTLGCYTVTLSGGEPFVYPKLADLVAYVRQKRMVSFTTTNGLAVSKKRLKDLEAAGLCALNFSIHGPREFHDKLVGVSGAYDRILEMGEYCARQTSIITLANHVLTRESIRQGWYQQLWDTVRLLGFRGFNVLPVCMSDPDTSGLLTPEELKVFDDLADKPWVLMDTKNYSLPRCPAAKEEIFINNFGEAQPCAFIPISFGNVRKDSLATLLERIKTDAMFQKTSPVCLAARDHAFIDQYLVPAFKNEKLPTPIEEIRDAAENGHRPLQ